MEMTLKLILGITFSIVTIIMLVAMIKSGHWFKALITTSLSGFAALLAVNLLSATIQIIIPINWYTIAVSGILGAPGTILTLGAMAIFLQ